jgi:protein TonB
VNLTDSVLASAKPGAAAPAKPGNISSAKSSGGTTASPGSVAAATPAGIASAKSGTIVSAKPAPVSPAKSDAVSSATPATPPAAPAQKAGRNALRISRETAVGMLVKKVSPEYPLEAKVARVQGTVVLNATISTTGEVSSVDVVSGPPLLQSAATNAVKQWQYKPFSFNGQPVEVETTIHVVFGEGSSPAATPSHP